MRAAKVASTDQLPLYGSPEFEAQRAKLIVFQHRSGTPVKTGLSAYYCYQIRWKGGVPIGADRDPLASANLSITLIL